MPDNDLVIRGISDGLRKAANDLRLYWADAEGTSFHIGIAEQCDTAADHINTLEARVKAYEDALTPSGDTKAAYHGEFFFTRGPFTDTEGEEYFERVYVPWDTTKEIMAAIRKAALRQPQEGDA